MTGLNLYRKTNFEISRKITRNYSTSFSLGIRLFSSELRPPIEAIYGFVRFADEIVDTFHDFDKKTLLDEFKKDTYVAIERGISLNPVLDSFQKIVNHYNIDHELIEAFLRSMEMDLEKIEYHENSYTEYIYGSAEVVGLMCLRVFTHGKPGMYENLKDSARSLGAAFQKINFLRDLKDDYQDKGRTYFPGVQLGVHFSEADKREIEKDIKKDFDHAYQGLKQLPPSSRLGVLAAYRFYLSLFHKIARSSPQAVLESRIRISNVRKAAVVGLMALRNQFNLL